MKYWGVPFHVIETEWTDDQFFAMLEAASGREKSVQKKQGRNKAARSSSSHSGASTQVRNKTYSLQELTKLRD